MSKPIRPRGRPKGTGLNDEPILGRIADLKADNPELRTTAAIRLADPAAGDATIRRLQAKWKERGEALLMEAQQKAARAAASRRVRNGGFGGQPATASMFERMSEITNGSMMKALQAVNDRPTMKAMERINNDPTLKMLRDIHDSPTMRMMRQINDSPTVKMMRELNDSPIMRAMKEIERLRRMGLC